MKPKIRKEDKIYLRVVNKQSIKRRKQRKYNVPVIAHFKDKSIRFNSILEAERILNISYHLIFESCVGKIRGTGGAKWEFENGADWLHYYAFYVTNRKKYTRYTGFNG